MRQSNLVIFGLIALVAVFGAIYYFLQLAPPEEVVIAPDPTALEKPEKKPIVHYPVPIPQATQIPAEEKAVTPEPEAAPSVSLPVTLPPVQQSDKSIQEALAGLSIKKMLYSLLVNENFIQRMVVTVDSLTEKRLPRAHLPLIAPGGRYITSGTIEEPQTSKRNHPRYANYVKLLESIDQNQALKIYVHFYSLFQSAYEQLGYKNAYFNDRLVYVLGHLLETPEVDEPILLAQPSVLYTFAEPALEKLSAGQKILLRIGPEQRKKIKQILAGYLDGLMTLQP